MASKIGNIRTCPHQPYSSIVELENTRFSRFKIRAEQLLIHLEGLYDFSSNSGCQLQLHPFP